MAERLGRWAQVLEAEFEEFAARGFGSATIGGTAEAGGLRSPASIYGYFRCKEDLFGEVLGSRVSILQALAAPPPPENLPPEEAVLWLGQAYVAFARFDVRTSRFPIREAVRWQEGAGAFIRSDAGKVMEFPEVYLEGRVGPGSLLPHEVCCSSVRAFEGALRPQVAGGLFPAMAGDVLTDGGRSQTAVSIFLRRLRLECAREDGMD